MWEQNPDSGQGIPLRECLPVFLRRVQAIKDGLRERDDAFNRHLMVGIATGSVIHSFQLTDLGLCWFKPVGGDRESCLSEWLSDEMTAHPCRKVMYLLSSCHWLSKGPQASQVLWTSPPVTSHLMGRKGKETAAPGSVVLLTTFTNSLCWLGKENEVPFIISNGGS